MGRHLIKRKMIDYKNMYSEAQKLFDQLGEKIDPKMLAIELSAAQKQLTLVAKAMFFDADVIILDEPTSALTDEEVQRLFKILMQLKDMGKTLIYISHRLDEILQLSDSTTVLRDGKYVGTYDTAELTKEQMINLMLGHSMEKQYPIKSAKIGDVVFGIKDFTRKNEYKDISFEVHSGEVFGIYGLLGSGRSEIVETIFGLRKKEQGTIILNGKEVNIKNPRDAKNKGITLLTEDRRERGMMPGLSVAENFALTNLRKYAKTFLNVISKKSISKDTKEYTEIFSIKGSSGGHERRGSAGNCCGDHCSRRRGCISEGQCDRQR